MTRLTTRALIERADANSRLVNSTLDAKFLAVKAPPSNLTPTSLKSAISIAFATGGNVNEQVMKLRKSASAMVPLIEEQLAPLRKLSDFEVFQTGGEYWFSRQPGAEIQVRFSRKANPLNPAPSFVVRVECPTAFDTAVTAFIIMGQHPYRNEEKPILFLAGTPTETIAQGVLKSCEADFKRLIARWVK